jgi:hypothetical protein
MADANAVIRNMATQIAQLTVDKAVLAVELDECRAALAAAPGGDAPEQGEE